MNTLASQISSGVNNFSFDFSKFNQEMVCEHKTLQQTFTKLCLKWILFAASNEYGECIDGRNEASHKSCKILVDTFNKYDEFGFEDLTRLSMV